MRLSLGVLHGCFLLFSPPVFSLVSPLSAKVLQLVSPVSLGCTGFLWFSFPRFQPVFLGYLGSVSPVFSRFLGLPTGFRVRHGGLPPPPRTRAPQELREGLGAALDPAQLNLQQAEAARLHSFQARASEEATENSNWFFFPGDFASPLFFCLSFFFFLGVLLFWGVRPFVFHGPQQERDVFFLLGSDFSSLGLVTCKGVLTEVTYQLASLAEHPSGVNMFG